MLQGLRQDFRLGLRNLYRSPGFSLAAVAILAVAIGSTGAIYSVVHSVMLRPLPYPDSGRIVKIAEVSQSGARMDVALPNYRDWVEQSESFTALAAVSGGSVTVSSGDQSRRVAGVEFHGDPIAVYGVPLAQGRSATAEEVRAGDPLTVVSNGFARSMWGASDAALGQSLQVGVLQFSVIGVLAPSSDERADVFVPAPAFGPDRSTRTAHNWEVLGRLAPDVALADARLEMRQLAERLYRAYPEDGMAVSVTVVSLLEHTVRNIRPALTALLVAVVLLLTIACANIANLLLARRSARERELAVRGALGAGRLRLTRQQIVENLPLALLGGVAGAALCALSFEALLALTPYAIPRRAEIALDHSTWLVIAGLSLAAGLLVALPPALQPLASRLADTLRSGPRAAQGFGVAGRLLTAGQIALALALLTCAGLVSKSFLELTRVEAGFNPQGVLVTELQLPADVYSTDERAVSYWNQALDRVASIPGVSTAAVAHRAPLEPFMPNGTFAYLDGDKADTEGYAWYALASSDFFQAAEIPVLSGRSFGPDDNLDAPHVAVINQTAAERLWPGEDPVGRRMQWVGMEFYDPYAEKPITIIGVVGDVHQRSLARDPDPTIYVNFLQRPLRARDADLLIKADDPAAIVEAVRAELTALDASIPARHATLASHYQEALAQPRFQASLVGFFAACALLLSSLGLFSTMAYRVSRRTREFGVRLAVGATGFTVQRQVLTEAFRLTAVGAVTGLVLAAAAGDFLAAQLFGVQPQDLTVFAAALAALTVAATLAAWLPAHRAAQVDPMTALRQD